MDNNIAKKIEYGAATAFLDSDIMSEKVYRPQFLSNNYREGRKILSSIEEELMRCQEFYISVAFITLGGITPLLQTLSELERHGINGKILTTDYLNFSEPKALKKLSQLKNIEVKIYKTGGKNVGKSYLEQEISLSKEGFHTKGYIFRRDEIYSIYSEIQDNKRATPFSSG